MNLYSDQNLWKEYPGILRINPGKLLKTATLSNRKEWAKDTEPDKEEQEWLEEQIEKQERIRKNFDIMES